MSLADSVCAICSRPMIYTGKDHHPACDPEDGHLYRVDTPKDVALRAVSQASPELIAEGLQIVRATAKQLRFLSANETRDAMTKAGITGPRVGAVFNRAAKARLIVRDGFVPSTHAATHQHPVSRWRSLIYEGRSVA